MLVHEIVINVAPDFRTCKILKVHGTNSLFQSAPVITAMYNYQLCREVKKNTFSNCSWKKYFKINTATKWNMAQDMRITLIQGNMHLILLKEGENDNKMQAIRLENNKNYIESWIIFRSYNHAQHYM